MVKCLFAGAGGGSVVAVDNDIIIVAGPNFPIVFPVVAEFVENEAEGGGAGGFIMNNEHFLKMAIVNQMEIALLGIDFAAPAQP